jgi:hypothetical protein
MSTKYDDRPAAPAGPLTDSRSGALASDPGVRPLRAFRDRAPDARDAMTRVFRTRGRGLVAEFGAPA